MTFGDSFETIRSFDGSRIAARSLSTEEGTPLLVANAVGAGMAPWRKVLADVTRERAVYTWDHRGLLDSGPPASDRLDPGAQAEDAAAVLDHFGHERCLLASWSNGSRIALEFAYRYPERVAALVLVCGSYGHAALRFPRYLEVASLLPTVTGIAKHFAGYLEGPFKAFVGRPEITGIIRQSGLVGANADTSGLIELLHELTRSDLKRLLATFEAVVGDADPDLLAGVQAPTLLVAGEKDPFAPLRIQDEMAAAIPNVDLKVYDRATHYLPLEFPAKLSDDMRRFFKDWT